MQSFSDFCKKNFNFDHSVKTVHKSSGVKIENSATPSGGSFNSYTKVNFPAANGKAEVQLAANGKPSDTKAKFEFGKVAALKDFDLTLSANSSPEITLEANYKISSVATKVEFSTDLADKKTLKPSFNASSPLGSGKGKATVDAEVCLSGGGLKDYNFKLDYSQKNLLAQAKTERGRSVLTAWVAQQCCPGWYWGAQVQHKVKDGSTNLTLGSKYKLDENTSIFKKVDTSGILSTSIQHTLANPAVKVNVAAQHNLFSSNACAAEKFGLGMTFGDF